MIIAFELMVLFGGISALTSWVLLANLPTFEPLSGYRSRFSSDEFGLVVHCGEGDAPRFEAMLREAGAEESRVRRHRAMVSPRRRALESRALE